MTAVNISLFIFIGLRPLNDLGYTLFFGWRDLIRIVLGSLLAFTLLIPIGYAFDIFGSVDKPSHIENLAKFLTILFTVSLPQEILFRGIIQNLLHSRMETHVEIWKYTRQGTLNQGERTNYKSLKVSCIT